MLLPDNMKPELSIYYNGGVVLSSLKSKPKQDLIELYKSIKENHEITFSVFLLSLDWLYLIDLAKYNERGEIELCL
ncbi:ABC-three component system middle component 6 [Clostridium nigeriense]|uniref:ABC-three component system middle component 6 n=1 Tax=Clostridium nigeriense TaxID=1805470 RepID=UPI00082B60C4|nr:ABC-three component system middle component 6 [Clostridium nigeriense]